MAFFVPFCLSIFNILHQIGRSVKGVFALVSNDFFSDKISLRFVHIWLTYSTKSSLIFWGHRHFVMHIQQKVYIFFGIYHQQQALNSEIREDDAHDWGGGAYAAPLPRSGEYVHA